jgi:hypothetical protein
MRLAIMNISFRDSNFLGSWWGLQGLSEKRNMFVRFFSAEYLHLSTNVDELRAHKTHNPLILC